MKNTKVELFQVVDAVLYRLKTGVNDDSYR